MNSSSPSMHLILFFLFLLPNFSKAQTGGGIVTPRDSLTAKNGNSSWTSRSGDFAFGFQPLDNNSDLFLLSIWYNQIPEKTIIWYANGDKPAPEGSKVELTSEKGLVLTTPQGDEIWKSQNIMASVLQGVMADTGNFVLLDTNSRSSWESFKNPTDTLLPSQVLSLMGSLGHVNDGETGATERYHVQSGHPVHKVGIPPKQNLLEEFTSTLKETFFADDPLRHFKDQPRSRYETIYFHQL